MRKFTFYNKPILTVVCIPDDSSALVALDSAARLAGAHLEMLLYYSRAGLIDALHGLAEAEMFFEQSALDKIRRIEHYRRHLGVGRRALPLVCALQRQADRQHIELRFLNEA